jgi:hypothetical protein
METTNSWNNLDFQRKLRHVPRVCANVSQMVCPLPSSFTAPSYCKQSHHVKALEYSFEDRSASLSLATACLDAPPRFPANRRGTPTPSWSRSFRPSMGAIIFISQTNQWEAYASATHNCWIADLKLLDRAKLNFESEERTDSPMGGAAAPSPDRASWGVPAPPPLFARRGRGGGAAVAGFAEAGPAVASSSPPDGRSLDRDAHSFGIAAPLRGGERTGGGKTKRTNGQREG